MTDLPDEIEIPEDAGEHADALRAILKRIPEHWGQRLSIDAGWYPIVVRLDTQLAALDPVYELHQVKEKFGGLRYYTETHLQGSEYEQFRALVAVAEAEAGRTCERCGGQDVLISAAPPSEPSAHPALTPCPTRRLATSPSSIPRTTMVERSVVELTDGHVWEITTENGTRHLIDLRDRDGGARRMRIPGPGRERGEDNGWIGRIGAICHRAMDDADDYNRNEVVVGEPCRIYGPGFGDWWTTTTVIAVRKISDASDGP